MQRLNPAAIERLQTATVDFIRTLAGLIVTIVQYVVRRHRRKASLAAENLFLRKQLALFQERETRPRRADDATRASLAWLMKYFSWRDALVIVTPATLIRWHREGFRLFWRLKSRSGRPAVPPAVRQLVRRMALDNPTWGEERIAHELLLELGLRLSPRTVRTYMPEQSDGPCDGRGDQRCATFVRNHAEAIVACDFFAAVTTTVRVLYVFVIVEHATRKILHVNVTTHPSSDWALQQLRGAIPGD